MSDFTETPELPPPGPQPIPWERPGATFGDLWSTLKLIVTAPGEAFSRLRATNAVGRALIFGLIVYVIASAIAQLWSLVLGDMMRKMLEQMTHSPFFSSDQQAFSPVVGYVIQVLLSPIIFVIATLICSGIVHLLLMMLGGAPGGFTTTLRVNCYSAVAVIASVIPFIGGLISMVWWIVLAIIGLREAHRITTGRAAAAVLIPLAVCCVCAIVFGALFATAIAAALGAAGQ